jgi:beta-N-acetylhexosaminidase
LQSLTEPPPPEGATVAPPSPVETALNQANWVIFAMLNVDPALPESRAVKEFLAARPEAGRTQKLIAFAFDAPYYLDTTEISKLTAYYGLYSRAGVFHEVATRILFQEVTTPGASPVSIPGVAYDLIEQTAPDPAQIIEIFIGDAGITGPLSGTPTATAPGPTLPPPTPTWEVTPGQAGVGETIPLVTGFIRDRNGHAVPDGTIVRFLAQYPTDGLTVPIPDAVTVGGIARASFAPPRRGQIDIRAESEPAFTSITLQITIQEEIIAVTIQPTLQASETPVPTATVPSPTAPPPEATATPAPVEPPEAPRAGPTDFLSLLGGLVIFGVIGLRLGGRLPAGRGRRLALFALLGALVGYNYYALGLPGAEALGLVMPVWSATILTWLGGMAGLGLGWLRYGRTRAFPTGPTSRT